MSTSPKDTSATLKLYLLYENKTNAASNQELVAMEEEMYKDMSPLIDVA